MAVANWSNANSSGVEAEEAKLMDEKEMPLLETSGTVPMVLVLPHVISLSIAATESAVSAGRAVLPTRKHAFCRFIG